MLPCRPTMLLLVQVDDHTTRAIWLGKQLHCKTELLERVEKNLAAAGKTEEEVIWVTHNPGGRPPSEAQH